VVKGHKGHRGRRRRAAGCWARSADRADPAGPLQGARSALAFHPVAVPGGLEVPTPRRHGSGRAVRERAYGRCGGDCGGPMAADGFALGGFGKGSRSRPLAVPGQ
jgi:hypothetical protein